MHFDVTTLDDVKADTNQTRQIYSQEEITLALRCLCDTRALRARRDHKPRGLALREELPYKRFYLIEFQKALKFFALELRGIKFTAEAPALSR